MKKTININLAGIVFSLDEDAFQMMSQYLDRVKESFKDAEGRDEIIGDIEARIAELFEQKLNKAKQVINLQDTQEVIAQMGEPEEMAEDAGEDQPGRKQTQEDPVFNAPKRIFRDPDDKILGGVAGGLAAYFGIDPVWVRLIFVGLFFAGPGFVAYLILWIVIPKASTTAERLQMRGKPVNLSTIEKSIRDDLDGLGKKAKNFAEDSGKFQAPLTRFANQVASFLGEMLRIIFTFLGKLIGFVMLFIGTILLIALFTGLFWPVFNVDGNQFDAWTALDYLIAMFGGGMALNVFLVGISITMLGTLVLIVLGGIRILFKKRTSPMIRNGIAIAISIAVIMSFVGGGLMAREFSTRAEHTVQEDLPTEAKTIMVTANGPEVPAWDEDLEFKWYLQDGKQIISKVNFTVEKSTTGQTHLVTKHAARGRSRTKAYQSAAAFSYEWSMEDSTLILPRTFTLPDGENYRSQSVQTILKLKEGDRVYLDPTALGVIYDIKNTENIWDHEMVGRTWEMRPEGLTCLDCPAGLETVGDSKVRISEEGVHVEVTEDGKRKKVIIDEDGVQIEEVSGDKIQELEKKIEALEKELQEKK